MDPSRLSGAYDAVVYNLMEDMGVTAQIEIGKLYYIRDGKLCEEAISFTDYIKKTFGIDQTSTPSPGWITSLTRTFSTFATGCPIKEQILSYFDVHAKSVISVSKKIIADHKILSSTDDIHKHNLLKNFTTKIEESIKGLENLNQTYKSKGENRFVSRMNLIIRLLQDQIIENNSILLSVRDESNNQKRSKNNNS